MQTGEERGDGRQRPRGLGDRLGEEEPPGGERVEVGARARAGAVAPEAIGTKGVDEQHEHVRLLRARHLAWLLGLSHEPDVAPCRYAGERTAGTLRVGCQHDLGAATGGGAEVDALVEPAPIPPGGGGIHGAGPDLPAVERQREAHPAALPVVPSVALDADAEAEDSAWRNIECEAYARGWRDDQAGTFALAGEPVARPDLAGPHRVPGRAGHDGGSVEAAGEIGDRVVDGDGRRQRVGTLPRRHPGADAGDCEDGRQRDESARRQIGSLRRRRRRMRHA